MASFFDKIFGIDEIDKIKAPTLKFTKYNQLEEAKKLSSEGISSELEDIYNKKAIEDIYKPIDFSLYGGNSARAISGSQQIDSNRMSAMVDFRNNLNTQDINAKLQGHQMVSGLEDEKKAIEAENQRMAIEIDNQKRVAKQQARAGIFSSIIQGGVALGAAYLTGGTAVPKLNSPSKDENEGIDFSIPEKTDIKLPDMTGNYFRFNPNKMLIQQDEIGKEIYKKGVLDPEGYQYYNSRMNRDPFEILGISKYVN